MASQHPSRQAAFLQQGYGHSSISLQVGKRWRLLHVVTLISFRMPILVRELRDLSRACEKELSNSTNQVSGLWLEPRAPDE